MKVLIVCQKLNDQVQLLASELEKMSIQIELIDSLHPLRLLLNKYDLIHFIHNDSSIDLKTALSAWSAKTLGISTLLTTYTRVEPSLLQEFEFNLFDAVTLPYISELKKMRFFSGQKIILPYLPLKDHSSQKSDTGSESQIIFPVLKGFDDLLKINLTALTSLREKTGLYVDAHQLKSGKFKSSALRKAWTTFLKENPQFKDFKLFTERTTLYEVLSENLSYTFLHHLDLTSDQVAEWTETALAFHNFLILHEDQATGFSNLWKTEKNCLIYSPRLSVGVQYHIINKYIEADSRPQKLTFDFRSSLDTKLNELARLYTKVAALRTSLTHGTSAKMNS
jgi:hypothetical protein